MTLKEKLTKSLKTNLALIREYHGSSFGLQIREINLGAGNLPGAAVFIDGMADTASIDELFRALLVDFRKIDKAPKGGQVFLSFLKKNVITSSEVAETQELNQLFDKVLMGDTALIFDGIEIALTIDTKGWKSRGIEESDAEIAIRGPRDAFTESLQDSLALIRRRIRVPQLWVESFQVGSLTRTQVAVVYIKGLAGEEILEEMRSRIGKIDTDSIIESGDIEDFIEDAPFTIFPLLLRTERPDRVVASLLEGQVAVVTDGTPFVLTAPATAFHMLQAPDDHSEKFPIGTFIRLLRFTAFTLSIFLPGFYVAVINFHQELLPTTLYLRISATREGVPFPVVLELLIMESVFEILREAGIRLPASIGPAISIVGALVLGDAAIAAGIVSPPVVIIVALTAIASFAVPNFALGIASRLVRFVFIGLGAIFGLFGIQFGLLILLVHLCSLRSFGVPYMTPAAPLIWRDMKDHLVRVAKWGLITRPRLIGFREPIRQSPRQSERYLKIFPRKKKGDENED